MNVHDLDGFALLIVGGRNEEHEIKTVGDQRRGNGGDPRQQRA